MYIYNNEKRPMKNKPELIIALDFPDIKKMMAALNALPSSITWFKVGLELFTSSGEEALRILNEKNKNIFLDLKLHDIPNTVASAIKSSLKYNPKLITIHASGGEAMIKAAKQAASISGCNTPKVIAVTTLTSLNDQDLIVQGITRSLKNHVAEMAKMAISAGADGIVCSPLEVSLLRQIVGHEPIIVTPGIRLPGNNTHDQKRISSPADAVRNGADFLVVGRSVLEDPSPSDVVIKILAEMKSASLS